MIAIIPDKKQHRISCDKWGGENWYKFRKITLKLDLAQSGLSKEEYMERIVKCQR